MIYYYIHNTLTLYKVGNPFNITGHNYGCMYPGCSAKVAKGHPLLCHLFLLCSCWQLMHIIIISLLA